jgi:phenylalanine-4-hydroxylase
MSKHIYKSLPLDENGDAPYSLEENQTWEFLLNRQKSLLKNRATDEFIKGIEILQLENKIPQHYAVTKILNSYTGWGVEPVPALIQPELFFTLLANKKFPAANFIRIPKDIDYIMEPDVFHELFGHCPLLTVKPYSDFMYEFGKMALTVDEKLKRRLFRLFWFTIEFGLMKTANGFRAYGGGILSSKSEIIYSVESEVPERIKLDPSMALRTPFRIDILQPVYYYIESYEELFKLMDLDLIEMAKESLKQDDLPAKFEKKKKA